MRSTIRFVFPRSWWSRHGSEFEEDFWSDHRRLSKWLDLVRTAAELWWREAAGAGHPATVAIAVTLVVYSAVDAVLGIGMDERVGLHLASHWWGAPFLALAIGAAALTCLAVAALMLDPRRRRWLPIAIVALFVTAFVGSAVGAAVSDEWAAGGAGVGLVAGVVGLRLRVGTGLSGPDIALVVATTAAVVLGWRTATAPLGPAVLTACVAAATVALMAPKSAGHAVPGSAG